MSQTTGKPILEVNDLRTYFYTRDGVVRSVDGVSFSVSEGETLAIVGESGCGKSVTSLSILRLIASPPGKIVSGSIKFHGEDLLGFSDEQMRDIRGDKISMIFQEPMTSLNPVLTIGRQIGEVLELHRQCTKEEVRTRILELLKMVNIPEPESRIDEYPHQLSGGMRQRIMIAMALACDPEILIADEPTTALDVTIQAQILNLMRELRDRTRAAIILITHDLGVVAEMAQRVVVMYAGRKVEEANVFDLFEKPMHPYTLGLLNSMPRLDDAASKRLVEIPGMVPSMRTEIVGCAFAPRCSSATERCTQESPVLKDCGDQHWVACWNPVLVKASV
ncbi:ABC transporter ATP-binding protein [Polynucleobacter sp.]|uniref:ABC transporter ATP-binding protein n=1 Tax=Polynucleobacter sp. TaxID=2029855 RepID=UPI003341A80C